MSVFSRKGPRPDELERAYLEAPDDEDRDLLAQNYGRATLGPEYDPSQYLWGPEPENDLCRECYEWRRFPPGQRHFGWGWWRTCEAGCKHAHHNTEVWIA